MSLQQSTRALLHQNAMNEALALSQWALTYELSARLASCTSFLSDSVAATVTKWGVTTAQRGRYRKPIRQWKPRDYSVAPRIGYHVLDVPSHSAVPCSRGQETRANTSAACLFRRRGILPVAVLRVAVFERHSSERGQEDKLLTPVFVKACAS
jgi:hypothetical protein